MFHWILAFAPKALAWLVFRLWAVQCDCKLFFDLLDLAFCVKFFNSFGGLLGWLRVAKVLAVAQERADNASERDD